MRSAKVIFKAEAKADAFAKRLRHPMKAKERELAVISENERRKKAKEVKEAKGAEETQEVKEAERKSPGW